ncbi:hypothetical protein M0R04_08570 [Candidatus Dojkabacteria bacterium]|jgi:hypothetical protein|nr:hypothetical protein [Candidatus Dojkabacteria bacterium]
MVWDSTGLVIANSILILLTIVAYLFLGYLIFIVIKSIDFKRRYEVVITDKDKMEMDWKILYPMFEVKAKIKVLNREDAVWIRRCEHINNITPSIVKEPLKSDVDRELGYL